MPINVFTDGRIKGVLCIFLTGYGWIAFIVETFRAFSLQSDKWRIICLCTLLFMLAYPYMPNIDRQIAKTIRSFSEVLGTGALMVPFFFWFLGILISSARLLDSTATTSLGAGHNLPAFLFLPLILFAAFTAAAHPMQVLTRRSEEENRLRRSDQDIFS